MKALLIVTFLVGLAATGHAAGFSTAVHVDDLAFLTLANGPIECANKAYRGPFSREQSMDLCRGATSEEPADCALTLYAGPFSREQSVEFCRRTGTMSAAQCAIDAYRGPYSREEALSLCKQNDCL